MLDDVEKRLNTLFDRLNNQEVGEGACALLLQLIGGMCVAAATVVFIQIILK
jgi:hypothetical protein